MSAVLFLPLERRDSDSGMVGLNDILALCPIDYSHYRFPMSKRDPVLPTAVCKLLVSAPVPDI